MEPVIISSIIGGGCTIAAPVVTLFIKAAQEHSALQKLSKARRDVLRGTWGGQATQPGIQPYPVTFEFKPGRKILTGELSFDHSKSIFMGGYYDERYMKIDYRSKDPGVIRFGSAILNLAADNKSLSGKFVGYGPERERLVSGVLDMEKKV